jgi:hypothetical protein
METKNVSTPKDFTIPTKHNAYIASSVYVLFPGLFARVFLFDRGVFWRRLGLCWACVFGGVMGCCSVAAVYICVWWRQEVWCFCLTFVVAVRFIPIQ